MIFETAAILVLEILNKTIERLFELRIILLFQECIGIQDKDSHSTGIALAKCQLFH
jgi:hypothetical protein